MTSTYFVKGTLEPKKPKPGTGFKKTGTPFNIVVDCKPWCLMDEVEGELESKFDIDLDVEGLRVDIDIIINLDPHNKYDE